MASISIDKNRNRTIQFVGSDRRRFSIRLGKVNKKQAESFKNRVEILVSAKLSGLPIDSDTAKWLRQLDDRYIERLANVGLAESRESSLLGAYVNRYIKARKVDVKPATIQTYERARNHLFEFFTEKKPLRDITPGDADEFRLHLKRKKLAEATIRKTCSITKQILKSAIRQGLLDANPFEDVAGSAIGNPDRMFFVTRKATAQVMEVCPDHEWKLIIALCRYGGLRCPSEVLELKWSDINWEKGQFCVRSSKTEHHVGKASRLVPIFPELYPYFISSFEQADTGSKHCITRYRGNRTNLRTQFMRIIQRSGLEVWPKLFQNLRSSRETELVEQYPAHIVTKWIGHSAQVAVRHYLQIREEDFTKASYLSADLSRSCNVAGQNVKSGNRPATLQGDIELKKLMDS